MTIVIMIIDYISLFVTVIQVQVIMMMMAMVKIFIHQYNNTSSILHQEYQRAVIFRLGRVKKGGAVGPGVIFCIEVDVRNLFDVLKRYSLLVAIFSFTNWSPLSFGVFSTKNLRRSFLHHSLYGHHPSGRP